MKTFGQLLRYGIIGLGTNAGLYGLYLLVTWLGVGHKTTMTATFILGTLLSFFLNRRWTFSHRGSVGLPMVRFFASYGLAYLMNYVALVLLVDQMGYPHQIVQAIMVFVNAAFLFLLQKVWVFRDSVQRIAVAADR